MSRQTRKSAAARLRAMHDKLVEAYGPQHWWPAKTPFEVVLGAYLTQNTSWKAVEVSLANLRIANALTVEGIRALSLYELQALIKPSGFYTRKAPALKAFIGMLDSEFDGSLQLLASTPTPALRHRLLALPGVGPETADAILLYALGHTVPVADEYLRRIAVRHNLIPSDSAKNRRTYDALVQLTVDAFAADPPSTQARFFNEFHALTVAVGKLHCGQVPDCTHCPLSFDLSRQRKKAHSGKE